MEMMHLLQNLIEASLLLKLVIKPSKNLPHCLKNMFKSFNSIIQSKIRNKVFKTKMKIESHILIFEILKLNVYVPLAIMFLNAFVPLV